MENRNQAQKNREKGTLLYDAVMEGMSYTAAVIRTNVFQRTSFRDSADALRTTLKLLEATDASKIDEVVRKAERDIRAAMRRMTFFGSGRRAGEIDDMIEGEMAKDGQTPSSQNAFVRRADEQIYSSVDGTTARTTGVPKKKE